MSPTIPLLWTNDDITAGRAPQLQRQLDFVERHGLRGDFFVIPSWEGKSIDQDAELLRIIAKARNRGHGFYQHGFQHTPFESGVPLVWVMDFVPAVRDEYDARRMEIEAGHTVEALIMMLEAGRRIWRRAFGEDSPGYRPGWGSCRNLFRACGILGYEWTSARTTLRTVGLWNLGRWDAPVENCDPAVMKPYRIGRLIEFPLTGDYAFTIPNDPARIDAMVELAVRDADYFASQQAPFILASHPQGLAWDGDSGYAVHEKMLPRLLNTGRFEPMTMSSLVKRYEKAQP